MMLKGKHSAKLCPLSGDWRYDDQENNGYILRLYMRDITHLLSDDRLMLIDHNDIAYKGFNLDESLKGENCVCCDGERFKECDTSFPGILMKGQNTFNKPYRMIDGKHRLFKLIYNGINKSSFYILEYDEIQHYLKSEIDKK